jgi:putative thioredoxin
MIDFDLTVVERSRTVPVVVDFWADWCGPCEVLGSIVEALVAESGGRWELVKVDVDAYPRVVQDYGLRSVPTVKMFHDGRVVAELVGLRPVAELRRWLEANLPPPGA